MKSKFNILVFPIVLMVSCSQENVITSVSITPEFVETATKQPLFVTDTLPASTTVATLPPSLSEKGPFYLLYKGLSDGVVVYDIQSFGRKSIARLNLNYSVYYNPYLIDELVSPDGRWFAYHSLEGDILTLNLLSIADETEIKIVDVISQGSEQKLVELDKQLPGMYPELISSDESVSSYLGFREGVRSVAWSPDSRYLAFAAQIDGLSSDVYIYDLQMKSIHRLNDDMLNVKWITWSPDGKYILFFNDIPGSIYSGKTLHLLDATAGDVKDPKIYKSGTWWLSVGWRTPTTLYISHHGDGGSWYGLGYFDLETKTIESLWEEAYEDFAFDAETNEFAFSTENGLYFMDSTGNVRLVSESVFWIIAPWGGSKYQYIASDYEYYTVGVSSDGLSTKLGDDSSRWSISPNGEYLIIFDNQGLRLLNNEDEVVRTIPVVVRDISWNPDSSGFFLSSWSELYYILIPYGELLLVDSCPSNDCEFSSYESTWLP